MADVVYSIHKTENGYISFEGNSLLELKLFLYPEGNFEDCCGYINYLDDKNLSLSIASDKKYGVYLGYSDGAHTYLSLFDTSSLHNLLDVWGDDLFVSEGLFIPPQPAWKCISEFIKTGRRCTEIDWITPEDLPEDGNYI